MVFLHLIYSILPPLLIHGISTILNEMKWLFFRPSFPKANMTNEETKGI